MFDALRGPENSPGSAPLSEEVLVRCHAGQRRAPPWPWVKYSLLCSGELMPGEVHPPADRPTNGCTHNVDSVGWGGGVQRALSSSAGSLSGNLSDCSFRAN